MNYKNILALFGVMLFGAGLVMAISGATATWVLDKARWVGSAGSDTTEGGNITAVNVSSNTLTDRWADYFGNVTGGIVLTDSAGTNNVYLWSWSPTSGGEVCLSDNSSFAWASAVGGDGSAVDTAMGWSTGADTATLTYTGDAGAITFNGVTAITDADSVSLAGLSSFDDVVVTDGVDFAYCTNINSSGTNYNNESANFEVMVPTPENGTIAYYFFAELN